MLKELEKSASVSISDEAATLLEFDLIIPLDHLAH